MKLIKKVDHMFLSNI